MSDVPPAEKAAEALEREFTEFFGPRCPDHDPDCLTCEAWGLHDRLLAALRSPADAQTPVGVEAELIEKLRVAANGLGSLKSERGDYGLLDDAAEALARVMGERDEARDRVDELESYGDSVADEFERDLWKQVRALLDECNFEWGDVDPDGIYADQAAEHIRETLRGLEQDAERQRARAEAAEKEAAALRSALYGVIAQETETANATVRRMTAIARAALTQGGTDGR